MIRTKDVNLSVWGDVDTRTGITNFSVNLSEFPGLEILMSSIIGSNFHDLIWQEKIIREIKPRRVAKVQKTDDGVQSPADVANSKISRTLPRAKYVYTGEKTRTMEGYVIKQTIDRDLKRRGIAPCHIDIHKTRLRYSYPYEAAVREYATKYATAIGEEKENLHRILLDTRLKLNKPSETKKNSLPPGFALNTIQDPETRKQFPVETWVIAFWSPKPSDDEQKSPALMYKKYFRGKAAATDYIDQFVLSWIVEEAILEKSPN
ncbi:hypothetical protein HY041_02145 [Candidatus Roizmanbacteria bacterium]|nr:hypothetical protein [Candidatus Roizmanbacteria bacterium]